jgi:hypothetical protein
VTPATPFADVRGNPPRRRGNVKRALRRVGAGNAKNVCGSKEWWRLSVDRYDVMHHDFSVRDTCDVIADLVHEARGSIKWVILRRVS